MRKFYRKLKRLKKRISGGFSLMETLMWVGIVAVFSSLVGVVGVVAMNNARVKAAQTEMNNIKTALLMYFDANGSFPGTEEGIAALFDEGLLPNDKDRIKDPWQNDYIYTVVDDGGGFILKSLGADKKEGGDKAGTDIVVTSDNIDEGDY